MEMMTRECTIAFVKDATSIVWPYDTAMREAVAQANL